MTTSTRLKLTGMANVAKDPGQVTKTVAFGRVSVLSYLCLLCLDIHGNTEKSSEVAEHVRTYGIRQDKNSCHMWRIDSLIACSFCVTNPGDQLYHWINACVFYWKAASEKNQTLAARVRQRGMRPFASRSLKRSTECHLNCAVLS